MPETVIIQIEDRTPSAGPRSKAPMSSPLPWDPSTPYPPPLPSGKPPPPPSPGQPPPRQSHAPAQSSPGQSPAQLASQTQQERALAWKDRINRRLNQQAYEERKRLEEQEARLAQMERIGRVLQSAGPKVGAGLAVGGAGGGALAFAETAATSMLLAKGGAVGLATTAVLAGAEAISRSMQLAAHMIRVKGELAAKALVTGDTTGQMLGETRAEMEWWKNSAGGIGSASVALEGSEPKMAEIEARLARRQALAQLGQKVQPYSAPQSAAMARARVAELQQTMLEAKQFGPTLAENTEKQMEWRVVQRQREAFHREKSIQEDNARLDKAIKWQREQLEKDAQEAKKKIKDEAEQKLKTAKTEDERQKIFKAMDAKLARLLELTERRGAKTAMQTLLAGLRLPAGRQPQPDPKLGIVRPFPNTFPRGRGPLF